MNEPWRDELAEQYTPTVRGTPVEWSGRVRDAMLFNWGNHIIFAPTGGNSRDEDEANPTMEADQEKDEKKRRGGGQ